MPYKEILAVALTVVGGWYAMGGQKTVLRNVRKAQISVLRDLGNTRKWGNPSLWNYKSPRH